jgi:hypothetical protein
MFGWSGGKVVVVVVVAAPCGGGGGHVLVVVRVLGVELATVDGLYQERK